MADMEVIIIQTDERKVPFTYPANDMVRSSVKSILSGNEYAAPIFPNGYRVDTLVDVGANVGAGALWFLHRFTPRRLVCYEPSHGNFKLLKQNVAPFTNVECINLGLSNKDQSLPLYLGKDGCMQSSLFPSFETQPVSETVEIRDAAVELEKLGGGISALKLDTEGSEVDILLSLGERLSRIDIVIVEFHCERHRLEMEAIFRKRGFILGWARVPVPHLGVNMYLHKRFCERVPAYNILNRWAGETAFG